MQQGAIDCDLHPSVPNLKALHPYMTDHWRDIIVQRGLSELESIAYPANPSSPTYTDDYSSLASYWQGISHW